MSLIQFKVIIENSTVNLHYVTISTLSSCMTHSVHLCYKINAFLGFKNFECEKLLSHWENKSERTFLWCDDFEKFTNMLS